MRLKDKVVIAGSSRGMGRLTATDMAKEGAKLVINETTPGPVDEVVNEIKSSEKRDVHRNPSSEFKIRKIELTEVHASKNIIV